MFRYRQSKAHDLFFREECRMKERKKEREKERRVFFLGRCGSFSVLLLQRKKERKKEERKRGTGSNVPLKENERKAS